MTSLAEDFTREQARVRELLGVYRQLGPTGAFGALMLEQDLAAADQAAASGDVVEMIRAYKRLRACK